MLSFQEKIFCCMLNILRCFLFKRNIFTYLLPVDGSPSLPNLTATPTELWTGSVEAENCECTDSPTCVEISAAAEDAVATMFGTGNVCAVSRLKWSARELRISALGAPNIVTLGDFVSNWNNFCGPMWFNAPPFFLERCLENSIRMSQFEHWLL